MKYIVFLLSFGFIAVNGFDANIQNAIDYLIKEIDRDGISNYLRNLTMKPHLAGTEQEHKNARMIAEEWEKQGLDEVHMPEYDVLLSYPDFDNPNYVTVHDDTGSMTWKSQGRSPAKRPSEEESIEVPPDFNAYSAPGNVSGDIVYVNFGTKSDYDKIEELGVNLTGKIVIVRYGKIFRANKVAFAQAKGASGIILYSDPKEYAEEGPDAVYPDTIFMPETAAAFGTTLLENSDPLTPFYPAIASAYRLTEEEAVLPRIPVMPLSYKDAEYILGQMAGEDAPSEWQGGLNFTYKLGPGLMKPGWEVKMEVNTHNQRAKTYNVIGMIKGELEPDRYVVLGNHRDAWIFGALDPSSGTAALLELTRTLMQYIKETGWRPRRTLIFASWGAEEYGLIGSSEWVQQFEKLLSDRTILYINVDKSIEGNATLRSLNAPLLYKPTEDIMKAIPNPNPQEIQEGRPTVFDTWVYNIPSKTNNSRPQHKGLGAGSDYRIFQHTAGIPSVDFRYTNTKGFTADPLYHTLHDSYFLVAEIYDKGFHYHASVTQAWGAMAIYFSESEVLPLNVVEYASFLVNAQNDLSEKFSNYLTRENIVLDHFFDAGLQLLNSSKTFASNLEMNPPKTDFEARRINDQMMMMDRSFVDPRGLPGRPSYNHILMAPGAADAYAGSSFPGLSDVWDGFDDLSAEDQTKRVRTFKEHLAACTHAILVASKVLSEELW